MNIKINQTMSEFQLAQAQKKLAKEIIGTDKVHNTSRNAIAKVNEVLAEAVDIKVNKNKSLTNLIKDTKKISKAERKPIVDPEPPIVDPEPEKDPRMTRWYLNGVLVKEALIEGGLDWTDNPSAFDSCEIGTGVTSIGNYAFYYCSGLTSVTIPNSVKSIGAYAFESCWRLEEIIYGDTLEKFKEIFLGVSLYNVPLDCTIVYTDDIIHLADIIDDISNPGGSGSGSGSDNGSGSNNGSGSDNGSGSN